MSSPSDSPTTKHYKNRSRRVSFNIGSAKAPPSPPAGLFSAAESKPPRYHNRHSSDRRSRAEDVGDAEDQRVPRKPKTSSRAKTADGPTITASQAAGEGSANPGSAASRSAEYSFGQGASNIKLGNPGVQPINTNINPALSVNPIYTHLNNNGFRAGIPVGYPAGYPVGIPGAVQQPLAAQPLGFPTMAAADPVGAGVTFVPAVPDATNGPMLHTYMPRSDAAVPVAVQGPGGVVYVQSHPGFNTTGGVPLTTYPVTAGGIAPTTAPMTPFITQQPGMAQPVFVQAPTAAYGGCGGQPPAVVMMPGGGAPMPGNYGSIHPEPALGIGQTQSEVLQEQLEFAYANNLYEPQDFKPADDDKSRHYWVRELDGNWTQRSRATIDHIGCRWYITDGGVFYAVRLPN